MTPVGSSDLQATIAVLPGDGIGPEVTAQAVLMLQAVAPRHGHTFHFEQALGTREMGQLVLQAVRNG